MAHPHEPSPTSESVAADAVRTQSGLELLEQRSASHQAEALLTAIRLLRTADVAFALRLRQHLGLSGTEFAALTLVDHCEDTGTFAHVKDVASSLGVTSAAATVIVDRLETNGHMSRTPDPADGRSRVLRLTAATRTALRGATRTTDDALDDLVATVSVRDATRIRKLLDKTTAILNAGPQTESH